MKKLALTMATAMAAIGGAVALTPGTALADSSITVFLTPASNPFLYVEVQGASTDSLAAVDLWHFTAGGNQQWTFEQIGSRPGVVQDFKIVNKNSGKCLWTDGIKGDLLRQAPCSDTAYVVWQTVYPTGDVQAFVNPVSGLYMDVMWDRRTEGASLIGYTPNGQTNQQFNAH